MRKQILIIGGEGHGSVIASCINDNLRNNPDYEYEIAGYINDFESCIDGYPVLGKTSDINKLVEAGYYFAWGIHLIGKNKETKKAFDRMKIPKENLVTIVHHSAFLGEHVNLGQGCLVMAHTYIAPRTRIGNCSMIKANVCIGHDVVTGPLCHFAMGCIVGSYTEIGTCSDISLGSVVLEHKKIGDYSMLGAHSLATHDIPDSVIYVGNPASYFRNM